MTTTTVRPGSADRWWLGPVVWSGLSQVMSSVTNFGLLAALTVSTDTAELGRVSAVLSVYLLTLASCRSLFTESMVAAGGSPGDTWRWAIRRVVAAGLLAVPVAVVVAAAVGLAPSTMVLLVGAIPPLLVQDAWRYRAWAQGRPARAVALDVIWLAISVVAAAVALVAAGSVGPTAIVGAWAIGGAGSAALGPIVVWVGVDRQRRADPISDDRRSGPGRHRELAWSQTLASVSFNLGPLVLATVLSPTLAGAAKALLLPFAPILSLVAGVRLVTLPTLARWAERASEAPERSPALIHAGLAATAVMPPVVALALAAGALPSSIDAIDVVAPHLWAGALLCVLFVIAQLLADGVALGPGRARAVRLRLLATVVEWAGLLAGAWLGGVAGLVRGWTAGLAVAVVVWFAALTVGSTSRRAGRTRSTGR